jgi:RNA recognition motif-containing protein
MNIYIGNISYKVTVEELQREFESFGRVDSAKIIKDQYSGRSKGFGFVEMPDDFEAEAAIETLNGREIKGRKIKVNLARARNDRNRTQRGFNQGSSRF